MLKTYCFIVGSRNKFLEIRLARTSVAAIATDEGALIIDGKQVTVAKVMVYKSSWMETFYLTPILSALTIIPDTTTMRRATVNNIPPRAVKPQSLPSPPITAQPAPSRAYTPVKSQSLASTPITAQPTPTRAYTPVKSLPSPSPPITAQPAPSQAVTPIKPLPSPSEAIFPPLSRAAKYITPQPSRFQNKSLPFSPSRVSISSSLRGCVLKFENKHRVCLSMSSIKIYVCGKINTTNMYLS